MAFLATKTLKLVSSHAHNSSIHILPLICHVVYHCLVVIAIASEGRDLEFKSHFNCLLRDRKILCMCTQSATWKKKQSKVQLNYSCLSVIVLQNFSLIAIILLIASGLFLFTFESTKFNAEGFFLVSFCYM